jgi:hydroxypyruvate isomerase
MTRFSANLGFLWTELTLPEAIHAAARAGFDAVECHWPYNYKPGDINAALKATGLPMIGLNTPCGDVGAGEKGLSALLGRELDARAAIDEAIAYAQAIDTPNVHVMAGVSFGEQARQTFIDNLRYATKQAAVHGITILIEPLNHRDAPGYFLSTSAQAAEIIAAVDAPNLKLMFDCYHLQIMEGNLAYSLKELLPIIGHVQIASVPFRQEPDAGEINYPFLFSLLCDLDYRGYVGAEYKPKSTTDEGLAWMSPSV